MGFRTVVMLNNDTAHQWEDDPKLGQKIAQAMNGAGQFNGTNSIDNYGHVVECVHCDSQTIAVLSEYSNFAPIGARGWNKGETDEEVKIALLKAAAEKLGFSLVKKSKK